MTKIKTKYYLRTIFTLAVATVTASVGIGQMLQVGHLQVSTPEVERTLNFPSSIAGFVIQGDKQSALFVKLLHLTPSQFPKNSRGSQLAHRCDCIAFGADYSKVGSKQDRMTVDGDIYGQPGYAVAAQNLYNLWRQSKTPLPTGSFTGANLGASTWHFGKIGAATSVGLLVVSDTVRLTIDLTNFEDTTPGAGVAYHKFSSADALAIDKLAKTTLARAKRLAQKM